MFTSRSLSKTPGESEPDTVEQYHYHNILFGGDQLTVARIRGSQRIRQHSEFRRENWRGLFHVSKIGILKSFCLR